MGGDLEGGGKGDRPGVRLDLVWVEQKGSMVLWLLAAARSHEYLAFRIQENLVQ